MTTTPAHAFLSRIERLRALDRSSFDIEVTAVKPLWLPLTVTSETAINGVTHGTDTSPTSGNDGGERSPQLPH